MFSTFALEDLTTKQMVRIMLRKMMTMEAQMANIQAALAAQGAEIGRVSDAVNNEVARLKAEIDDALQAWQDSEADLVQQHLTEAQTIAAGIEENTAALGEILKAADPEDDSVSNDSDMTADDADAGEDTTAPGDPADDPELPNEDVTE